MLSQFLQATDFLYKRNSSSTFNHLIEINLMNMLDLIYHYNQWGMRQNHVGRRKNNRLDDPNSLLISVGMRQNHAGRNTIIKLWG